MNYDDDNEEEVGSGFKMSGGEDELGEPIDPEEMTDIPLNDDDDNDDPEARFH